MTIALGSGTRKSAEDLLEWTRADGLKLAMATLGSLAAVIVVPGMFKSKPKVTTPPIKAESGEEEKFIQ